MDMHEPRAVIFDVFGTVVDWRSGVASVAGAAFARRGIAADPFAFADAWRGEYQPAMARIRSGGRAYVALDRLHRENLDIVLDRFGLGGHFDEADRAALNRAWEQLLPWPDSVPGIAALRRHFLVAPCSNGSIALMARLAKFAGISWDAILGAEIARDYKPRPAVYLASCAALGLDPGEVMMAAAHADDLVAARDCGLMTAFLPRPHEFGDGTGEGHESAMIADAAPAGPVDIVARDIANLAEILTA
jgi:2-haloacid dehalogenase